MYVLVHHTIHDPKTFWSNAQTGQIPAHLKVHQTLAATDGRIATCLWEAESVNAVRDFLESISAGIATNTYSEAANREGFAIPPAFQFASA